jgi:hypothetical protein
MDEILYNTAMKLKAYFFSKHETRIEDDWLVG